MSTARTAPWRLPERHARRALAAPATRAAVAALLAAGVAVAQPGAAEEPPPAAAPQAEEPTAAQAALEQAAELKLSISGPRDLPKLNRAIDLLESALEQGLGEADADFAEEMLIASLLQRASAVARPILDRPPPNPRRDARWLQLRRVALGDLRRVVSLDAGQAEAHYLIGRLQVLPLGDQQAAREALTKAAESAGDSLSDDMRAQAFALRGALQTDPAAQQADFAKATELLPGRGEFHLLVAQALARQEKPQEALAAIAKAEALSPENAAVFELKGRVLRGLGKLPEAIAAYDRVSEIQPDAVGPYQYRGELYSLLGNNAEAIKQLTRAIALAPGNLASPLIRARLYLATDQLDKALRDIDSVLVRQPGLLSAILIRATILAEMGRSDEAIARLEEVAELSGDQPEIVLRLAAFYMDAGRADAAIDAVTRVIEATGGDAGALRMRGDLYLSIGKHNQAMDDFARSYELDPEDPGLLNNYAWTLATSPFEGVRDGARAIELATRACELTEYRAAHILSTLAAAYAESGDFAKAIEFSEKAVRLHAADQNKTRDMREALAAELASYKSGRPWRELQRDGQPQPVEETDSPDEQEETPLVPLDF